MKKKVIAIMVCTAMILSLVACESSSSSEKEDVGETTFEKTAESNEVQDTEEEDVSEIILEETAEYDEVRDASESDNEPTYSLGETVSTDIRSCSLEDAQFALALNDGVGENYATPKEYDYTTDKDNRFVAGVGHTLVYFELHVTSKDRTKSYVVPRMISIIYDGVKYSYNIPEGNFFTGETTFNSEEEESSYNELGEIDINLASTSVDGENWTEDNIYINIDLGPGETIYIRGYVDIPTEIENLNDSFDVQLDLPTSSGGKESFYYHIPERND